MKNLYKYLFTILILLLVSCSSEKETVKDLSIEKKPLFENDINVNVKRVFAWINLMPNTEPRFNITGEFSLLKTDDIRLDEIELTEIKIYQDEKEIYRIKPIVRWNNDDITSRSFAISTLKGLSLVPTLDQDQKIDALFEFDYNGEKLLNFIQSIHIEKTY
ncbi:MAG: hypothetical protein K8F60_16970 [Melioribacteraceae bacterium]|jgi:hypothetical protein|nr:hypothetical protein [Ignavibacteriota bacterium]MBZ0184153.1 hypothetical protein [Melioribacteraceae bacterium]